MGFRSLPHLWSAATLAQENRFWGWVPGVPPGQCPGVSGGVPADSLWGEVWGQQALGLIMC